MLPNGRSPLYSLPSASEIGVARRAGRDDEHAVPVDAREPAQVDRVALAARSSA